MKHQHNKMIKKIHKLKNSLSIGCFWEIYLQQNNQQTIKTKHIQLFGIKRKIVPRILNASTIFIK